MYEFAAEPNRLTEVTKKDRPSIWGQAQQNGFESPKNKLCKAPVLAYPNFSLPFSLPFMLTTVASKTAIAAIFSPMQDGVERPIAYSIRPMNKAEQAYSASETEMLALVWATKKFRCYLYGKQFLVRTPITQS